MRGLSFEKSKNMAAFQLQYVSWAKTLPTAIRPWRIGLDTPYYSLSTAECVTFAPNETKSIRTGVVVYLPDHVCARITTYTRLCLTKPSGASRNYLDDYYPLRMRPFVFMKSDHNREIMLEMTNMSTVESYELGQGEPVAVLEFRQALTPTFVQAESEIPSPLLPPPLPALPPSPPEFDHHEEEDSAM